MNHYAPMQRVDGRWEYTCNRYPTGYCHLYSPIPDDGAIPAEVARRENEKMAALVSKFHSDGHGTMEEACECYKRFLIDTRLRLVTVEPENASQQHRCQVCKTFTACYSTVGPYRIFILCPKCATVENVTGLLRVEESWES